MINFSQFYLKNSNNSEKYKSLILLHINLKYYFLYFSCFSIEFIKNIDNFFLTEISYYV